MKKYTLFLLLIPIGSAFSQSPLSALVAAEKSFAQFSRENGTKAAFTNFLATDGIIFEKGKPVNGQKFWQEEPNRPGLLTWQPVAADIAASGDFGFTTGPWEFRPKTADDKPVAFGQYVTVWKKQANGAWKAAIDIGITHPAPTEAPVNTIRVSTDVRSVSSPDTAKLKSELLSFDTQFIKALQAKGAEAAYKQHLSATARVYRMDRLPFVEKKEIDGLLKDAADLAFEPLSASVAISGDLGYVYGNSQVKQTEEGKTSSRSGNYLRIWKKDAQGVWKIVLDLLNLDPPA